MEPSEKDIDPQAPAEVTPAPAPTPEPEAEEPIRDDLISSELAPKLTIEDAEPQAPAEPDLAAVESSAPSGPAPATNLDLPSIELPHPAYTVPQQTPYTVPQQTPYAVPQQTPYAVPQQQPQPTYGQAPGETYAQPAYPPPSQYGQQPAYGQQLAYSGSSQLNPTDENMWATAAHWSAIVGNLVGFGWLAPLLILLMQGPKSARVRANAVESLNFEITFIIAMIVSTLLIFLLVGIVTTIIIPIAWLVLRILASVQTSSGQDYRYPLNIRIVK